LLLRFDLRGLFTGPRDETLDNRDLTGKGDGGGVISSVTPVNFGLTEKLLADIEREADLAFDVVVNA